jgi:hypothetical protein
LIFILAFHAVSNSPFELFIQSHWLLSKVSYCLFVILLYLAYSIFDVSYIFYFYFFFFHVCSDFPFCAFHSTSTIASRGDVISCLFKSNIYSLSFILHLLASGDIDNERSTVGILRVVDMIDLWSLRLLDGIWIQQNWCVWVTMKLLLFANFAC